METRANAGTDERQKEEESSEEEDLLLGVLGRDAMLAISCETDTDSEADSDSQPQHDEVMCAHQTCR